MVRTLLDRYSVKSDVLTALWSDIEHVAQGKAQPLFDRLFNPKGLKGAAWGYYMDAFSWDRSGQLSGRDQQVSARVCERLYYLGYSSYESISLM